MTIIKSNMTAPPPAAAGGGGLSPIGEMNSLKFDGASYLSKSFGTPTNNNVWTLSFWAKIASTSNEFIPIMEAYTGGSDQYNTIAFFANKIRLVQDQGSGGVIIQDSTSILRDTSAWYHITVGFDNTAQTLLANKYFIYINGVDRSTTNTTIDSETPYINKSGHSVKISGRWAGTAAFSGYLADIQFIDGQALTPHYFGAEVSGTWVPKPFDGTSSDSTYDVSGASFTYGSNGFHLDFSTRGGKTVSSTGNIQLNTSDSSSYIQTAVPSNLSPTNQALAFVNDGCLEINPWVPLSGDFTLELWISRNSSVTIPQDLFLFSDGHQFYLENGVIQWWDNTANRSLFAYSLTDSSWEHIALVRENGFVECYRNGSSSGGYGGPHSKTLGADWVKIGTRLQGGVNHIRISNNARYSGTSIADWQNTTHSFTPDNNTLLLITDQNNIDSTTFVDQSGSGGIDIGYDSSGNNNHWEES